MFHYLSGETYGGNIILTICSTAAEKCLVMKTEGGGNWWPTADGRQVPTYIFRNRMRPAVAKELLPFS